MVQSKDVLFIIDSIESLEPGHDTSLGLMEAALKNGDRVFVTTQKDLVIASDGTLGSVYTMVKEVTRFLKQQHSTKNKVVSVPSVSEVMGHMALDRAPGTCAGNDAMAAPDAVLQRQDDRGDWATQQIVARLHPNICILNDGVATLRTEDKIAIVSEFPHLCPPSIATADTAKIIVFAERLKSEGAQKLVLKATQSYGGNDVNIVKLTDENWQSQIQDYAKSKAETNRPVIVAQKFLPDVQDGDMRIFYANGQPIAAVNRVPPREGALANMAQGGTGKAVPLSSIASVSLAAAHQVAEWGKRQGIVLVGIDIIGQETPYITELNPGSPTGLIEAQEQLGQDVCSEAWAAVSAAIHTHQVTHSSLVSLHWTFMTELVKSPASYRKNATELAQKWLVNRFCGDELYKIK